MEHKDCLTLPQTPPLQRGEERRGQRAKRQTKKDETQREKDVRGEKKMRVKIKRTEKTKSVQTKQREYVRRMASEQTLKSGQWDGKVLFFQEHKKNHDSEPFSFIILHPHPTPSADKDSPML